jgi:hypothetical protein
MQLFKKALGLIKEGKGHREIATLFRLRNSEASKNIN